MKPRFIRRWIPISNKRDMVAFYKKKYKASSVLPDYGLQSVRNGKVGTNVEYLIIWD